MAKTIKTSALIGTLKKCLKARGVGYRDLTKPLGLSEASVKRLFATNNFTIDRLEVICDFINLSFAELARLSEDNPDLLQSTLSLRQEEALASQPKLLAFLYLILKEWTVAQILQEFKITQTEARRFLLSLDKLGIIAMYPNERIRVLVSRNLTWLPNGPLRRHYAEQVKQEFLSYDFQKRGEIFQFAFGELSEASARILLKKTNDLIREFNQLTNLDASLSKSQTISNGLMVAFRPWVYSMLSQLKNR